MKLIRLWLTFAGAVISIFITGFFITLLLSWLLSHAGLLSQGEVPPLIPTLGAAIAGAGLSLLLSALFSRHYYLPIRRLVQALGQVADGNFQIQLPETDRLADIQEMNRNFNKMVRELNSNELLQSDFIQNVSHEFKTPLASIEGYASLLYGSVLSEEQKGYAGQILNSTRQLSSLTGSILMLSRLENQQIVSEKTWFYLDEQLRQIILSMEPLWSRKQLELNIELSELRYYGNEALVGQIWSNLLSNAIKFTPEQGVISVSMEITPDQVRVRVQDTGIGMSEEVQAHIFNKFYQARQSRGGGNGLGLALVKKILALCSGSIRVESQPEKGSVFTVTLPVLPHAAAAPSDKGEPA